ncbi:MFS transporter [Neorhizobium alkalisoli]|uniref:MFS transporter n=1 Tax=Neorhizobium alkalisoli TaxID=528178 RepID=UPI000CF8705F|nr:MFS transporter [Neorhizobium alkalisoli]
MSDVISLEEGRRAFGANSEAYNDARPAYPPRVYDILRDQGAASQTARVFEIGAGTGQATAPLLALGCTITALEPDERLATTLADRLKHYGSLLTIMQSSFEDSLLPSAGFDLGVAAMAFHWLQPDSALAKVFRLLRPGGWWAMWWTVFGDPADMDPFQRRTQALFQPLSRSPSNAAGSNRPFALDKDVRMAELHAQQFRAYPALFRVPRFWAYGLCMSFSVGAFYAFLAGAPLAATSAFDLEPGVLGFFMGVTTLGYIFGSFLSGRYAGRVPLTTMMIVGRIVACACPIIGLTLFLAGFRSALTLFGPCILIGIGNGLTMPSANAGMLSVRPDLAGSSAGLAGAMTIGGGAVLSSATGAVLTQNNATYGLFTIILLSTATGLLAASLAAMAEKRDLATAPAASSPTASQAEGG